MPQISIIIPVYNIEHYLSKCLDSVINQTLKDIEIICVNDGSTDNSLAILEEYAEKDDRIILINQNNQGVSVARNTGINNAKSEFILFLDPDDWLDFSACEQAYNRITTTNADIVFYGRYNVLNEEYINNTTNEYLQQYENQNIPLHIIKHFIHNCWQAIFRLDFLKKNNIYFNPKQKVFEDGTFLLLCLYNQPQYRFLNQNLYYYFMNRPESATSGNINVIKNLILAAKCLLESNEFQNCKSIEHKIITIEKIILDIAYFYNFEENKPHRAIFCKQITEFKKWLYLNIDNSLLQKTPNIKKLNSYNIIKKTFKTFLNTIFSIRNGTNREYKIITILGIKIRIHMNKKTMPKVSVIIPVYNVEKYLRQCLDSLINQTLKDIEIICIDDGSTDSSLNILNEYASKDDRITILTQKNKGAGAARNKGIKIAKGEYLYFFDSDDFLNIKTLQKLYMSITSYNTDICVCKNNTYNDETGIYADCDWEESFNSIKDFNTFNYLDIPEILFLFCNIPVYTKIYKKSFIISKKIKFQETKTCNDVFFNFYTLAMASSINTINETLVTYRQGHSCLSKTREMHIECILKAARKIKKELRKANKFNILEQTFNKRISYCFNYELDQCNEPSYKEYWTLKLFDFLPKSYWSNHAKTIATKRPSKIKQCIQNIFSIKNKDNHKVITILGKKIKIKRKI